MAFKHIMLDLTQTIPEGRAFKSRHAPQNSGEVIVFWMDCHGIRNHLPGRYIPAPMISPEIACTITA